MDKTLTAKLLPAALICKGFITGMADCDYEIYLREVVNASIYFKSKSDGQIYTAPPDESHGEWDCISENYSLDFKLIASETALRARNLFSGGIYQMAEGVTAYCGPKVDADNPKYKPIQATRIFAALRSVDLAELKSIRKSKKKQQGIETDIMDDVVFEMELVKQVEVNIDYILMLVTKYHDGNCEDKEILVAIDKAIKSSLQLRSKKELIENFIATINTKTDVNADWQRFVKDQREADIQALIAEEKLKPEETRKFVENAFRDGVLKTTGTDVDRLMPPVSRFGGGGSRNKKKQTVIEKLKAFFEKYFGLVNSGESFAEDSNK